MAFLESKLMNMDRDNLINMYGQAMMRDAEGRRQEEAMRMAMASQARTRHEQWARDDRLAAEERQRTASRMSSPMPEAPVSDYNPEAAIYNTAWIANKYGVSPTELSRGASAAGMGGGRGRGGGGGSEYKGIESGASQAGQGMGAGRDPNMAESNKSDYVKQQMADAPLQAQHEREMELQQQAGDIEGGHMITQAGLEGGIETERRRWEEKDLGRHYDFEGEKLAMQERIANNEISAMQGLNQLKQRGRQAEITDKKLTRIMASMDYENIDSPANKANIMDAAELRGVDPETLWAAWIEKAERAERLGK